MLLRNWTVLQMQSNCDISLTATKQRIAWSRSKHMMNSTYSYLDWSPCSHLSTLLWESHLLIRWRSSSFNLKMQVPRIKRLITRWYVFYCLWLLIACWSWWIYCTHQQGSQSAQGKQKTGVQAMSQIDRNNRHKDIIAQLQERWKCTAHTKGSVTALYCYPQQGSGACMVLTHRAMSLWAYEVVGHLTI